MAGNLARAIHGIPVVASTSERDLLYPTPERDQRVQIRSTGEVQRYDGVAWITGTLPVNVRDYGARGDGSTNDTAAFVAAIAAAGAVGAIYVPPGIYRVSNLVLSAEQVLFGAGRQASILKAVAGSTGIMITDNGNAAKICIYGLACYANNESYTHIVKLGATIQHGTSGRLYDLWLRDAPLGYGLWANGNVAYYDTIETQGCLNNLLITGTANIGKALSSYAAGAIGLDLTGITVDGAHCEATASGGIPVKIYGDTVLNSPCVSTTTGYTHSHIFEVSNATGPYWAIRSPNLLGSGYTITNGVIKYAGNYYGGTSGVAFSGRDHLAALSLYAGLFELKYQQNQSFNLRIFNNGGTIQHRIGACGDSSVAGSFTAKVSGASTTLGNTPTGTDTSTAFATGGKIGNPSTSLFLLNTNAIVQADFDVDVKLVFNSSTTALTVWAYTVSSDVNGTTRRRLVVQFLNATSGAAYNLTTLPSGAILEVVVRGFVP